MNVRVNPRSSLLKTLKAIMNDEVGFSLTIVGIWRDSVKNGICRTRPSPSPDCQSPREPCMPGQFVPGKGILVQFSTQFTR